YPTLFRSPPTNAALSGSPATGPSTPGAGSCPNTPPPPACSTGSSTTPSWSSPKARATACEKPRPKEAAARPRPQRPEPGGDFRWPPAGTSRWPLTLVMALGRRNPSEELLHHADHG